MRLKLNERSNRYEIHSEGGYVRELTSGDVIEVFIGNQYIPFVIEWVTDKYVGISYKWNVTVLLNEYMVVR